VLDKIGSATRAKSPQLAKEVKPTSRMSPVFDYRPVTEVREHWLNVVSEQHRRRWEFINNQLKLEIAKGSQIMGLPLWI
jgi:hypothetical protein